MKRTSIWAALTLGVALTLTACSGESTPEVTPAPTVKEEAAAPEVTAEATPEAPAPAAEAERGTRENPLAVGEARKLSTESMWTVSAAATDVHDGYVVLPLTIGLDWASFAEQAKASGSNPDDPISPAFMLTVKFVSADGRTFTTMDDYSVDIADSLWEIGDVYPPTESVFGNNAVSVPNEAIPGGVWSIENLQGDRVFIAQS